MATSNTASPTPHTYARQALSLMAERNIEPTPINYAVWYHYVVGDRQGLSQELGELLKKKTFRVTQDVTIYLYNKYVVNEGKPVEKIFHETSNNTQSVLSEIMDVIDRFSGDTETYNKQVDSHVSRLSQKITDPALQVLAKELIGRAVAIRDSGVALGSKLDESRKEIVQLKSNLEKVISDANRDHLTNTGNRKALEAKLGELTEWAKTNNGELSLLMIDIDFFKKFNDTYGHLIGDEVLKKVAAAVVDSVKGKDFVARYGGEEFAVLLPSTNLAGGLTVAENIRKNITETNLVRKDTGETLSNISVSIGVAFYRPNIDSITLLISRADSALYRSKIGGRNRVTPESFEPV